MKYEEVIIDKERNIVRVTTQDERFYRKVVDGQTAWIPSVTWIAGYLPKGIGYYRWLAQHGWDESQALMEEAGERGTIIHKAIEMLLLGKLLSFDTVVTDRQLNADEWEAVMSFVAWFEAIKPVVLSTEKTVFHPQDLYAGTIDLICEIKNKLWIIDFKTSQDVWPSHKIQLSAYNRALESKYNIGILQVGYRKTKAKYKFTEIEPCYDLFLAAHTIWKSENDGVKPMQKDYPLSLSLKQGETNEITKNRTKNLREISS